MKYNTSDELLQALLNPSLLKRDSALAMKRRYKAQGNNDMVIIFTEGIKAYDSIKKGVKYCSFYNKPIDNLNLVELISLWEEHNNIFTDIHKTKYSIEMLGEVCSVVDYEGAIITPDMFNKYTS